MDALVDRVTRLGTYIAKSKNDALGAVYTTSPEDTPAKLLLSSTLRIAASLLHRATDPGDEEDYEEAGELPPEVEDAGGLVNVRPLVTSAKEVKLLAPLAAAALGVIGPVDDDADESNNDNDNGNDAESAAATNDGDDRASASANIAGRADVDEVALLSRFLLSRISTPGLRRLLVEGGEAFAGVPGARSSSVRLLDARAEATAAARRRILARRMAKLRAGASAAAAMARLQKAMTQRRVREAEEDAARRQARAEQLKDEAVRRRQEEV